MNETPSVNKSNTSKRRYYKKKTTKNSSDDGSLKSNNSNRNNRSDTNISKKKQNDGKSITHKNRNEESKSNFNESRLDYEKKLSPEYILNRKKRAEQIEQCINQLSMYSFKLFNQGKYVTTYGFNQKLLQLRNYKNQLRLSISIPNDYPKSAIKLNLANKKDIEKLNEFEEISFLMKNFNEKSKDLLSMNYPILAQINYLVQEKNNLVKSTYRKINNQKTQFNKEIVAE